MMTPYPIEPLLEAILTLLCLFLYIHILYYVWREGMTWARILDIIKRRSALRKRMKQRKNSKR